MIRCDWIEPRIHPKKDEQVFLGVGICCIYHEGCLKVFRVGQERCEFPIDDVVEGACGINHALIRTSDGTVYAIGSNRSGQCGLDAEIVELSSPTVVFCQAARVFAGSAASFIVDKEGLLYAFGCNDYGQLSLQDDRSRSSGMERSDSPFKCVQSISSGFGHTCVLADGQMFSCGSNSHDQLGFLTHEQRLPHFERYSPPFSVVSIACGVWNTAIITELGELYITGRAPFYQEGPEPLPELLKTIRSIKDRKSNRVDEKWVHIHTPDAVSEVKLGSSIGIALAANRRTIYVFDSSRYDVIEIVDLEYNPKNLFCAGRWWSIS